MGQLKHHVLEDMREVERGILPQYAHHMITEPWKAAERVLTDAAEFHFEIGPGEEHGAFGAEMFERDMFRLPFPTAYFTVAGFHYSVLASEMLDGGKYHLSTILCSSGNIAGHTRHIPVLMARTVRSSENESTNFKWGSVSDRDSDDLGYDVSDEELARIGLHFVFAVTVLLMSKDTVSEVVLAPEKLNVQRIRKGLIPISERRIVKIRAEARASAHTAAEAFRLSPRMHWRRGHFRRVREDLIVPVAPTIVGASDDTKPVIKNYVFQGAQDAVSC